jgi:sugar lactone lactonase YvrE
MVRYAALCILALGLAGCEPSPTQATGPVATVQVAAATDTATALGSTVQFSAMLKDAAGNMLSGKTVTWSSTTPAVAVVNPGTGMATAMANGWTSITASVEGVTGARTLTVAQNVATVVVTPATFSITAGATRQFSAAALDGNGNAVSGVKFLWVSSNANVAVVDTTGLARGIGRGEAIITAAARGQPGHAVLNVTIPAGRLVVASTSDNAVYLYDPITLARLSTFSVTAPHSAAVGPDGRIYAGIPGGQVIAIDPVTGATATLGTGVLAGTIYGTTVASGVIYASGSGMDEVRTMDLDGASLGNIVSPTGTNHRASAFGPDGSFYLTSFAGEPVQRWLTGFVYEGGFGGGGLSAPFGIATRANGDVIVTDQNQHAYFRFSREGVFLGSVSVDCVGQLRNLAVDQDDNLWIGCYGADAVVKFDTRDREVARLTVTSPSGVAFERP